MNRRQFLETTAVASALPFLPSPAKMLRPIGVQLYTVRDLMKDDFEGTIRKVSQVGYQEVEFAGFFGREASQVKALLDEVGMTGPSSHVPLQRIQENLSDEMEFARTVGSRFLVVPWLGEELRTLEGFRQVCQTLNQAGRTCNEEGLRLAYHNHDFEFEPVEGKIPMDLMLEECDPDYVDIELDLFWITKAGKDPLDYFRRYPGRFKLFHVKDMDDTPQQGFTPVGQGIIDFPRIFKKIPQAGTVHYFVENDQPGDDPLADIRASYQYLRDLEF
ncbi:MAG TPA: TIM barrel protein [Acidobacteriota bacterium]|nr:TIM barrel protein [Acidobacteriota bacterium]